MITTIDLNADMGEGFGAWQMGDDAGLLDLVSSANIACGFHAGDPDVMAATMREAVSRGVGLGAHPGFADLQGFGRREMHLPAASLANLVAYQTGAAQALARTSGGRLRHLKLHGALANMAARDRAMAQTCYTAALDTAPDLIIMAMAGTAQEDAVRELGCPAALEIFADRAYLPDGSLLPRSEPGAVLHDAEEIAARVLQMLREEAIVAVDGRRLSCRLDTICLHGDTSSALAAAKAIKQTLSHAGIQIARFEGATA
ncbi:hypothetical protein RSK20926_00210 [Roseobacter sp. SK209-2-6]|uniref:LamB/YcsF family protein n=1 Tax=Roseobacter sp. SK209-2-6 TaxID=388739 RepID=UPI0000F3C28C|nr:5-oxoprolinase subunit PxpA [Roseobacter sp. SK209-2-6]EBA15328.1 hypothetical protein RSK20926_00210 [Roseobacter sp. SK209-2-6]